MPSSFTTPLVVKKIKGGLWEVAVGFKYFIGAENSDEWVFVPTGFQTDFASVPRLFWSILPPDGTYSQSAVLHDFLYNQQIYTRKKSDQIFLESMGVLEVSWWKRKIIYRAVRTFGWLAWKKKNAETKQEKT